MNLTQKKSGIPGPVKLFCLAVFGGVLAVFGMVGKTFYEGNKALNMSSETTRRLADKIVDPNVSASELEEQGFYKVKYGGFFLDDCRTKVLSNSFNANTSNAAKADKISNCIRQEIVKTSARANSTTVVLDNN